MEQEQRVREGEVERVRKREGERRREGRMVAGRAGNRDRIE